MLVAAAIAMAALRLGMISAFSSVAACIFNVGPGLGLVGPIHNYSSLPLAGKWVLVFCMLVGRLEFYTVIILLIPEYWRK
jgi:trk system potassium uptake protein TrkH